MCSHAKVYSFVTALSEYGHGWHSHVMELVCKRIRVEKKYNWETEPQTVLTDVKWSDMFVYLITTQIDYFIEHLWN